MITTEATMEQRRRETRLSLAQERVASAHRLAWRRLTWWREFGGHLDRAGQMAADAVDREFRRKPWPYAYAAVLVALWVGGMAGGAGARREQGR